MKKMTLADWVTEIDNGLEYRMRYGLETRWAELEALYFNVHDSSVSAGPNIVYSTGDALLSTLTVLKPTITVKPLKPEYIQASKVLESVNNSLLEQMRLQEEVELATLHSFLWGRGILKIGYDSEWGWDEKYDFGGTVQPTGFSMTRFNSQGNLIETNPTNPGMPWVRAVPPHDIVVPWGTRELNDAPWIAHRVIRHIDDIRADSKYRNVRDLTPSMSMQDFVDSYKTPQKPQKVGSLFFKGQVRTRLAEYVELWEIHDRRTGRVMVLATNHTKWLRDEIDALQIDNTLPFVSIGFVPTTRSFWVTPDAYYIRHAQAELSDVAVQMAKQRRISALKFITTPEAFDPDELDKLLSPEVGVAAMTKSGVNPREAVVTLQAGSNQQIQLDAEEIRRNARELVGFSRNQVGEYETRGRRTATEAGIVQQASSLRISRRQLVVAKTYISVMRKVNQVIFEYWKLPRITEMIDEEGREIWISYNGPGLKGEYNYRLAFSDEPVDSLQNRRMEALQLYSMLLQDPAVDQVELRQYLTNAMNDPEFSRLFKGMIDNARVRLQMSKMQAAMGGVPEDGGQGQPPALPMQGGGTAGPS
jgi:hypothetical protein